MAGTHVAHDCVIGNHCVMANVATLGGHVQIGDHVIVGRAVRGAPVLQDRRTGLHRQQCRRDPRRAALRHGGRPAAEPHSVNATRPVAPRLRRGTGPQHQERLRTLYRADLRLADAVAKLQAGPPTSRRAAVRRLHRDLDARPGVRSTTRDASRRCLALATRGAAVRAFVAGEASGDNLGAALIEAALREILACASSASPGRMRAMYCEAPGRQRGNSRSWA